MKYSAVVLFAAGAYAAASSTGPITAAPAVATLTPQESCVSNSCTGSNSNVGCRASCYSVPYQASANVAQNVLCVSSECMSYQTANQVTAYGSCLASCRDKWFYNPTNAGGAPNVVATAGNSQQTGSSGSSGSGSGSNSGSGSGSGSNGGSGSNSNGSGTNASASASATGKSAANKYTYSAAGIIGAFGLLALAL